MGSLMGLTKGDTRSLDYSSHDLGLAGLDYRCCELQGSR